MLRIDDYFKTQRMAVEHFSFDYQGERYFGRGILTWNPDQGFHLEANIDLESAKKLRSSTVEVSLTGIIPKGECSSVRMRIISHGHKWALTKPIYLTPYIKDIANDEWLSCNFGHLVSCEDSVNKLSKNSDWKGQALYESYSNISLSDSLIRTTEITDCYKSSSEGLSGLDYLDDFQTIVGEMIEKNVLKLRWEQSKSNWTKKETWEWPKFAQDTLSIYYGETVNLLAREIHRNSCKYIEYRFKKPVYYLGVLLLLEDGSKPLNKSLFVQLTKFFTKNPNKAFICQSIFNQLLEASQQKTRQATELLTATILEAVLRTIDNEPFQQKKSNSKWKLSKSLDNFIQECIHKKFFSDEWHGYNEYIRQKYSLLRNRNAHPDWLYTESGFLSPKKSIESLNNLIYLSRFYGYMILAIAGFSDIKPNFPSPLMEKSLTPLIVQPSKEFKKMVEQQKTISSSDRELVENILREFMKQMISDRNQDDFLELDFD